MSGLRRSGLATVSLVLLVVFLGGRVSADSVSPGQEATQQLFLLVLVPAIGIGVFVMALVAYAALKFRVRKGHTTGPLNPETRSGRLETASTLIPGMILGSGA